MTATTPSKTYKPKVHIGIDTETLALDSKAAVINIGAVVMLGKVELSTFEIKIKPSSYAGSPFEIDSETMAWHEKTNPGFIAECEEQGVTYQEAAHLLADWVRGYAQNFELHMWAQGKDFDMPILGWLLKVSGVEKPLCSYRNWHCARDLLWLNPAARIPSGVTAHTALADALWMRDQFHAIVAKSTWYQRLFS